tara:strand:- start:949 stop:1257 length:309 start_codon:yes stop_codon:yes gene_type:complete
MIIGCFGMVVIIFCWEEVLNTCCTPYVQLHEEEDEVAEENHVELPVISGENDSEVQLEEEDEVAEENHVEIPVILGAQSGGVQATIERLQEAEALGPCTQKM